MNLCPHTAYSDPIGSAGIPEGLLEVGGIFLEVKLPAHDHTGMVVQDHDQVHM